MEMEYYDTVNKEWVVELWAVNAGDVLKVPDNSSDEYMKLPHGTQHTEYRSVLKRCISMPVISSER